METPPWKLLLVEDDEDDYFLTKCLLEEAKGANFDLRWIANYKEAEKVLRSEKFDAVLVDYLLGSRNGLDLVREAILMGLTAPVIVLTGQGSYEIDLLAMQSGAVDFLVKGQINAGLLERTIRYAIERKQAQDALRKAHAELERRVQERTHELVLANRELQAEVAERKRVEAQLRIQTTALEAAANGIFITDAEGNILWSNPAFSKMSGYTDREVQGDNPRFLKSGKHDLKFYQELWTTILSGKVWQSETTNRRKDGSEYIEEQTVTPVRDESGRISHFIAIKHDITARKKAEELIRRNAAWSEILAEISRSLVEVGYDYEAVLTTVTQKIASQVGDNCVLYLLSEDEVWLSPAAYHHRNPEALSLLKEILETGLIDAHAGLVGETMKSGRSVLFSHTTPEQLSPHIEPVNKRYLERFGVSSFLAVPLRVHGKLIGALTLARDQDGQPLTAEDEILVQNIADRAALAIANARLYRDLQSALEEEQTMRRQLVVAEKHSAMSRMVASVAHELNNPIQTIQNCLFLINQDIPPGSEMAGFIDMAISESHRVSDLVSQLRELYRPSRSGPMQPLDVLKILEEVHTLLSPHLQHQHVDWRLTSAIPANTYTLNGIADQIKQVFINICLNAIEVMQPNGGALSVEVFPSPSEEEIGIKFQDTGPGIPAEHLSQIFEPFFTTKESGTGLGLSICYDIVARHAGKISVESKPGEGATFIIWLPMLLRKE